ncbi:UNC93-like protein [Panulirus ornatus]|uniref:UNC93-like protein n=1 Tax=Panulirus ornatus TaxID=150431 RepID=UPI003A885B53
MGRRGNHMFLIDQAGRAYAEFVSESSDIVITRFFGIFFAFFQSTQVWGNLISSSVLSIGVKEANGTNETALMSCGYNFCIENSPGPSTDGDEESEERDGPPLWQIYTMASIYVAFAFMSSITIFIFVDPLSKFKLTDGISDGGKSSLQLLVATFNHMRHPYQLLIIPLTIWSGVEQAFLGTDFTAAYVTCGLGVHMVGYIFVFYGVCDSLCSISFTPLVKRYGRVPLFSLGFIINLILIITFIYWPPHPDDLVWFFIIVGLWGVADAVWQTQINALYGVIFSSESEAGFSNYRLWESMGFFIAYACSTVLCIDSKITILLIFLLMGIAGYYIIEALEKMGGLKKDQDGRVVRIDVLIMKSLEAVLED